MMRSMLATIHKFFLQGFIHNLGIEKKFELTVNDTDMAYHAVMGGIGIAPCQTT
jgi:hypothetical protein